MNISSVRYLGPSSFNFSMKERENIDSSWAMAIISLPFSAVKGVSTTAWDRLKLCVVRFRELPKQIRHIARTLPEGAGLKEDQINFLVNAFYSPEYRFMRKDICHILNTASAESVQRLLKQAIMSGLGNDDVLLNMRGLECITLEKLVNVCGTDLDTLDTLEKNMEQEVRIQGDRYIGDDSFDIVQLLFSVIKFSCRHLLNIVDSVVMASGKIGTTVFGSSIKIKGQKDLDTMATSMKLILCYIVLNYVMYSTTIGAEILAEYALIATGVTVLGYGLVALAVAYPVLSWLSHRFRPCPNSSEHATNMVQVAKNGEIGFVAARDSEINDLIRVLGKHGRVLFRGHKGSGKRGIIRGIVRRMAMGQVPDFLQNKKLFSLNLSELTNSSVKVAKVLEEFNTKFENHKDEVVIFIDQAHEAWAADDSGAVEQLENILAKYPYVILSSTPNDFFHHRLDSHESMMRIKKHFLESTKKEDTVQILREYVRQEAPHLDFEEGILEMIYEQSQILYRDSVQPGKAIKLLAEVITSDFPEGCPDTLRGKRKFEKEKQELRTNYYGLIDQDMTVSRIGRETSRTLDDLDRIEDNLNNFNGTLDNQIKVVDKLWKLKRLHASLEDAKLEAAIKSVGTLGYVRLVNMKNWLVIHHIINGIFNEIMVDMQDAARDLIRPINEDYVNEIILRLFPRPDEGFFGE